MKTRKITALLVAMLMLVGSMSPISARAEDIEKLQRIESMPSVDDDMIAHNAIIDALFMELVYYRRANDTMNEARINSQLEALGVVEMTHDQVVEVMIASEGLCDATNVPLPSSGRTTFHQRVTYNGQYRMQTITALPAGNTSPLLSAGSLYINDNVNNVRSISVAVLRASVSAGVGKIEGALALGKTAYSVIKSSVSGFTPEIQVTSGVVRPRYVWEVHVSTNFHFVSRTNNPHHSQLVAIVTNAWGWVVYSNTYAWNNPRNGARHSVHVDSSRNAGTFQLVNGWFLGWNDALNVFYGRRAPIHSYIGNINLARGTNGNVRNIHTIFLIRPIGIAQVM